jgi:hypothetical protein
MGEAKVAMNRNENEDDGSGRTASDLTGGEPLNSETTPSTDPIAAGLN